MPDDPTDEQAAGPSLEDETRKLLGAVQEWAQRTLPAPPSGHPGPECQWCPLCQFASILRGEHPEVAQRVVEAGEAIAAVVRALVETAAQHVPQPSAERGPSRPSPTPRVERIRLQDDDPDPGPA